MRLRRRGPASEAPPPPVDAAAVEAVYEQLLGRAPSPQELARPVAAGESLGDLLAIVLGSEEYAQRLRHERRTATATYVNLWTPELARYAPPPGTRSPDEVAEVGHDGELFLRGGTNDVQAQFAGTFPLPQGWLEAWQAVVRDRAAETAGMELRSAWLVVPEKRAVARDLLPEPLPAARRPIQLLRDEAALDLAYPEAELASVAGGAYLRTDTHLSFAGGRVLAAHLLERLGAPAPPAVEELAVGEWLASGDLGSRFDPPLVEVMRGAVEWPVRIVEDNRDEIAAVQGNIGTVRVTECDDAPDPRTCVVFGDSYGFGDHAYHGLAWWLGLVFRRLHFVWVPFGWDPDYARDAGAEVVVFQGAERFCVRAPAPRVDARSLAAETLERRLGMTLEDLG